MPPHAAERINKCSFPKKKPNYSRTKGPGKALRRQHQACPGGGRPAARDLLGGIAKVERGHYDTIPRLRAALSRSPARTASSSPPSAVYGTTEDEKKKNDSISAPTCCRWKSMSRTCMTIAYLNWPRMSEMCSTISKRKSRPTAS